MEHVAKCYYPDTKSTLKINVMADSKEIAENITTGRILATTETVTIRPHFQQEKDKPIKNPEYTINGLIADAKRIKGYKGISSAFTKAIEQKCKIVIIDFNQHFNRERNIDVSKISGRLLWRQSDFEVKRIEECILVFRENIVKITSSDLTKEKLQQLIKGLMPQ